MLEEHNGLVSVDLRAQLGWLRILNGAEKLGRVDTEHARTFIRCPLPPRNPLIETLTMDSWGATQLAQRRGNQVTCSSIAKHASSNERVHRCVVRLWVHKLTLVL